MKNPANLLQVIAGWIVSNVEAILLMCTPLLSALPSMFAAIRALEVGRWQHANLIGGIIEALGLASGALIGIIESHNQRHPDKRINPRWGYGVFAFYLVIIEALIISHTPEPVPILLPGLTVIGSVIVGFRRLMLRADEQKAIEVEKQNAVEETTAQHNEVEFQFDLEIRRKQAEQRLEIERAEAEQRLVIERQKVDAKLSKGVAGSVARNVAKPVNTPATDEDATDRRNRLLSLLQQHGDIGNTAFGYRLQVDRTTVYRDLKAMEKTGIIHKNGNGWEVSQ